MKDRLCIAIGLLSSFEHQITGSLKGNTLLKITCHGLVEFVSSVLGINHGGHFLEHRPNLRLAAEAVMQPISDMLR